MKDLKDRVLSRKFVIAILSIALAVLNNDTQGAIFIALGYLGVQGAIDHKNAG